MPSYSLIASAIYWRAVALLLHTLTFVPSLAFLSHWNEFESPPLFVCLNIQKSGVAPNPCACKLPLEDADPVKTFIRVTDPVGKLIPEQVILPLTVALCCTVRPVPVLVRVAESVATLPNPSAETWLSATRGATV